jgi:methyl-accepting chemotaxis protein
MARKAGMAQLAQDFPRKARIMLATLVHLAKWKVFYQIMIIILVMILFLGVQGFISVNIVDTMQKTTQTIFNDSFKKTNEFSGLVLDLEQIRINYLGRLTGKPELDIYYNMDPILDQVQYLKAIDAENKKTILKQLTQIKEIYLASPNVEDYKKINSLVASVADTIKPSQNSIFSTAITMVSRNNKFSAESKIITIVFVLLSALFSTLIGIWIAISISKPLKKMVRAAKSLAVGDLTKELTVVGCPEVTEVVEELNQATLSLRELVRGINEQSDSLFAASKELKEGISDTGESAAQVANAMEELAKASSQQAVQVNQAVGTIKLLSDLVKKVSNDTENIAAISKKVANSAKLGQKATNDVANEMSNLFNFTNEVAAAIDELSDTSEEINDITAVIEGIAEQTTLLALNASIEAARAGEQGQGFSVVASETGMLAEQSKQAVRMIVNLILQMKAKTQQAVNVMRDGISRAVAGRDLAVEATGAFEGIFETLMSSLAQIEEVAESARQMARRNEDVIEAISSIAAISEEGLASTEEVSATAQEQSASVEEVTALAENLSDIAGNLRSTVSVFEIGDARKIVDRRL